MCLRKLSEKEEKAELKKLPTEFPCWKIVQKSGHCRYDPIGNQPKIERRILVAQNFPARRMIITYPLSFHAYLRIPVLSDYDRSISYRVIKCWAKKKDIVRIGKDVDFYKHGFSVAVSKIRRK